MVVTIAPGPASSGVPRGTSAIFFEVDEPSSVREPVSKPSPVIKSRIPPAPCKAACEMF